MTGRMTFYDNEGKILTALDPDPCLISSELAELARKSKEAERESLVMKEKQTEIFRVDYQKIKNLAQNYDVIDCSSYSRSFTS